MDIAYEIGEYLQDLNFGTLGTSIFINEMPSEKNGIYVVRGGGNPSKYTPIEEAVIDIYTKNTSSSAGIAVLEQIKRRLGRMYSMTSSNGYIYSILVIGDVDVIGRDSEMAQIYKITLSILCRDSGLIS